MKVYWARFLIYLVGLLSLLVGLSSWLAPQSAQAEGREQQPTVSIPTVTGTPLGPMASVNLDQNQIHVRTGPGPDYPIIGILVQGQRVPAYGVSPGGDWVQIGYVGVPDGIAWVHASLISLSKQIPMITPPPTPTPRVTPTLDPTLAARFVSPVEPTRLPTFTPPAPVNVPTFEVQAPSRAVGNLPIGFVIIGLAVIGLFGTMLSFLRGR